MRFPSRRLLSSSDQTESMNGRTFRRDGGKVVIDRRRLDLGQVVAAAQRIVMRQQPIDLSVQGRQVGKIHETDGAPSDFILIGGTNAALGRADARCRHLQPRAKPSSSR
jgi:hypothetical protein